MNDDNFDVLNEAKCIYIESRDEVVKSPQSTSV